jgi:quinol monooxygenase YgiN
VADPAPDRARGLDQRLKNTEREDLLTARINTFEAKAGKEDELRAFLLAMLPLIRNSPGCLSCQLLTRRDDPSRIIVIETWETIEAHQASVKAIPPGKLDEARALLAKPPEGAYYDLSSG